MPDQLNPQLRLANPLTISRGDTALNFDEALHPRFDLTVAIKIPLLLVETEATEMKNQTEIEALIRATRTGDKRAEAEFFSKLAVRFLPLVTHELRVYPILTKGINLEEKSHEVCQRAVAEVKRLYPPSSPKFSLVRAVSVLHNVLDNFITNSLTDLAKQGNSEAENVLFSILRKKLMERVVKKRWRGSRYEYQDQ